MTAGLAGAALPILSTRSQHLWDALGLAYSGLGFDAACGRDEVFQALVLARLIEPTSKLDTIRVLDEIGIAPPGVSDDQPAAARLRDRGVAAAAGGGVRGACRAGPGDVGALRRDHAVLRDRRGRRVPRARVLQGTPAGAADHRRVADRRARVPADGARVRGQHGRNQDHPAGGAGVRRRPPAAGGDRGRRRRHAVRGQPGRARGCRAEVHRRRPDPRRALPGQPNGAARHPDEPIADGQVFTQPSVMGTKADPRRRTIFYQYRADRARRTLKGIDQQIAKAEKAVAGQAAVKRNRFVQLTGGTKSINRDLEAKARALAGLKGYVTNLEAPTAEYVMGAYHQLWQIEKSFRMSKTDLRARPIYHHKRDSIEAHLTIVFAALAVSRWLERRTGWSIKKFVTDPAPLPHRHHPGRRPDHHRRRPPARRHPPSTGSRPPACALVWPKSGPPTPAQRLDTTYRQLA